MRLRSEYGAAAERIRQRIFATHKDGRPADAEPSPAMREWTALQWSYEGNPDFKHETLSRYLPVEAVARVEGATPGSAPRSGSHANNGRPAWLPWIAAGVALLLLVIIARGRSGDRSRTQGAASGAGHVQTPEGYTDLSKADRQLLTRAGLEVLDSLEPYLYAAQIDDKPLPIQVLRDDEIRGYFMAYCREALKIEGATDDDIARMTHCLLFHLLVVAPERMKRLFRSGGPPTPLPAEKSAEEVWKAAGRGLIAGTLTLVFFKSPEALPPSETDAVDEEIPLELAMEPPATRLHPRGPNAAYAQQRLLRTFTARLIELSAA